MNAQNHIDKTERIRNRKLPWIVRWRSPHDRVKHNIRVKSEEQAQEFVAWLQPHKDVTEAAYEFADHPTPRKEG